MSQPQPPSSAPAPGEAATAVAPTPPPDFAPVDPALPAAPATAAAAAPQAGDATLASTGLPTPGGTPSVADVGPPLDGGAAAAPPPAAGPASPAVDAPTAYAAVPPAPPPAPAAAAAPPLPVQPPPPSATRPLLELSPLEAELQAAFARGSTRAVDAALKQIEDVAQAAWLTVRRPLTSSPVALARHGALTLLSLPWVSDAPQHVFPFFDAPTDAFYFLLLALALLVNDDLCVRRHSLHSPIPGPRR